MEQDFESIKDDILADAIATAIENEKEIARLNAMNLSLWIICLILLFIAYI